MFSKNFMKFIFVGSILIGVPLITWRRCTDETEREKSNQTSFRVAVFEHVPQGHRKGNTFREIINLNLEYFVKAIKEAHQNGVQLIVLPEDTLINSEEWNRSMLIDHILEPMPNPQEGKLINFCLLNKDPNSILRIFSCLALKFKIFIALNYGDKVSCNQTLDRDCPSDGYYLYNTLALFNSVGEFVAKYHKMHLYYEFHYNIPKYNAPMVYYDSPFGRLGFMLCFDLLYKLPGIKLIEEYKIDTILYSTYWFNYLPFIVSVQMQQSFAIVHNINLLAACAQIPETGTLGSGIYSGRRGALAYTNKPDGNSKITIATLQTNPKSKFYPEADSRSISIFKNASIQVLKNHQMNVSEIPSVIILDLNQSSNAIWCSPLTQFCCRVFYQLENHHKISSTYALLSGSVISGALGQHRYPIYQELCGFVLCQEKNCSTFGSKTETKFRYIYLSGTFSSRYIYPSVMSNDHQLLPINQWIFNRLQPTESIILVKPNESIIAVTLFGRYYDMDPVYQH